MFLMLLAPFFIMNMYLIICISVCISLSHIHISVSKETFSRNKYGMITPSGTDELCFN